MSNVELQLMLMYIFAALFAIIVLLLTLPNFINKRNVRRIQKLEAELKERRTA